MGPGQAVDGHSAPVNFPNDSEQFAPRKFPQPGGGSLRKQVVSGYNISGTAAEIFLGWQCGASKDWGGAPPRLRGSAHRPPSGREHRCPRCDGERNVEV
jgi:hypothetical protein